jgi:hypothetical protein
MSLHADIDPFNPARIVFDQPVTVSQAVNYLWGSTPLSSSYQNPLRPDSGEAAQNGAQRRFLVNLEYPGLLLQIQVPHISQYYQARLQQNVPQTPTPATLPAWVPLAVQESILNGALRNQVTHFQGARPWGDIVVWYHVSGIRTDIQVYREFPENLEFYLQIADRDRRVARILQRVYTEFNRDMRYYVEQHGYSPERARDEIRKVNDQCLLLVLEAAAMLLSAGVGIHAVMNAMRANAGRMTGAARQGRRSARPGANRGAALSGARQTMAERIRYWAGRLRRAVDSRTYQEGQIANIEHEVELEADAMRRGCSRDLAVDRSLQGLSPAEREEFAAAFEEEVAEEVRLSRRALNDRRAAAPRVVGEPIYRGLSHDPPGRPPRSR